MRTGKWRRFVPRVRRNVASLKLGKGLFTEAAQKLLDINAHDFDAIDQAIESHKSNMNEASVLDWLVLLLLQSPRAAHAQAMMDEHPHGYHDRTKRLYELIDFNDSFVSTVMLLPESELGTFTDKLKDAVDSYCKSVQSRSFSDEQFEAITHGLSREIAVYAAAKHAGLQVVMSSRTADAFGIDMQVRSTDSGRYINIDTKTASAFHFRLKDLIRERRVTPDEMIDAETKGYWEITNRRDDLEVRIILLRISHEELGDIASFRFVNESLIVSRIQQIINHHGLSDERFNLFD